MRIKILILGLFLAFAQNIKADVIPLASPEGLSTLSAIEAYLNRITTIRSRFTQVNDDGSSTSGLFLLKRPGRFRLEYDPPVPFLVLGTGNFLIYADFQLQEITHIPIAQSPVWPLIKEKISFADKSVIIDRIDLTNGYLRVAIRQSSSPKDGVIDLIFNPNPLYLMQWLVTDSQFRTTSFTLNNPVSGLPLDENLFHFQPDWKKRNNSK